MPASGSEHRHIVQRVDCRCTDLGFYSETILGIHGLWSVEGGGKQIPPQEKVPLSKELILWWRTFAY